MHITTFHPSILMKLGDIFVGNGDNYTLRQDSNLVTSAHSAFQLPKWLQGVCQVSRKRQVRVVPEISAISHLIPIMLHIMRQTNGRLIFT